MANTDTTVFSNAEEEQLVLAVKNGEKGAVTELVNKEKAFVQAIASHYSGVSLESDDIVQEGMLALLSAAYSYSPEKAAAFRTYAAVCISNRLKNYVKAQANLKSLPLNTYISIYDIDIPDYSDLAKTIESDESVKSICYMIDSVLSKKERDVLRCTLEGLSCAETAERLGTGEKSVSNALFRLRKKLKQAMNNL